MEDTVLGKCVLTGSKKNMLARSMQDMRRKVKKERSRGSKD